VSFLAPGRNSVLSAPDIYLHALLVGVLALIVFVIGDPHQAAIGFDSRFVLFAQEMLRHGPGFFPTTYGEPYADYSSTSTFLIYLFSLPLGRVTSLTAWLPTAISSALLVMLMYRLLAPYSRQWALLSITLLMLSTTFISETRAVSLDQMLATVAFAVFYLGYAADHFGKSRRLTWIFVLLVLGFAIRGPIGLVVPTGILCSYYILSGQWRRMFIFGFAAAALLGACIALLLLLAKVSGGSDFVAEVVRMQFTSRMDGSEGSSSPTYYFTSSLGNFAIAYPLAIVVLLTLVLSRWRHQGPELRLVWACVAAGLIVMVGLSVPQAKKARYMLPMVPMAAIIAAYPFQAVGNKWLSGLRALVMAVLCVLPGLFIGLLLVARQRFPEQLTSIGGVLIFLGLLQILALASLFRPRLRVYGLAACAVLAVWSSYIWVFEPVERNLYDTRSFSLEVDQVMQKDPLPLVLHVMGKDAKAIKFMVNLDHDLQPQFTQTPQQLVAVRGPAYVMMSNSSYMALKGTRLADLPVLLHGRFDKEDYVLMRVNGQ
jgi:4-amino-4-deoxy-L-arabinose transferase-like glycosyltransferase